MNAAAAASLLAGLPHAAWLAELDGGRVVAANAAAGALFGRPAGSLVGEPASSLAASPEDLAWWEAAAAGTAVPLFSDTFIVGAGGRVVAVSRSIGLVGGAPGGEGWAPPHALVVVCDRSVEQRVEDEHELLLADLQGTLEATADGILVTDLDGRIRACNHRWAELWDVPEALLARHDDAAVGEWMERAVCDPGGYATQLRALRQVSLAAATDRIELRNGRVVERVTRPLLCGGRLQGRVWSFRDLTERIAAEERIESLTRHDALTGLANRRLLAERVAAATLRARRDRSSYAVLVVDVDRFRHVNDSLGHEVGDRVLQGIAQRIQGCLRHDDLLARMGGDQFALLVQPADADAAAATARRVLAVVEQPWEAEGATFTLTCSIGIAIAPSQASRIDDLARHAEAAMRTVKAHGRAHFRLHQARPEGDRRFDMRLDQAMRQALVSGRFRLHYQPQVDLASGAIVGAEALMRWRDPELGEVPPSRFIAVAEDSGLIVALGDWVLGQAARQAAAWQARGHALPIAVNVSALQFQQAHFVDRVAEVLAASRLPPERIELELTESILLRDADEAMHRLHALDRLGVRLSIDDFGTGYSSLSYLKRFPIGKLKIDRSFVRGLPTDDSDCGIVRAILQMARALGKTVIAEGVETEAQRAFLADAGCDLFQGWLYAPALDSLSFERRAGFSIGAGAREAIGAREAAPAAPLPRIRLVSG